MWNPDGILALNLKPKSFAMLPPVVLSQLAEGGQMSHRYKLTLTPVETVLALVLIPCGHPYPRPVRVQILNKGQL